MKINPKEMEINKLPDKKLRIISLRKLNELQECHRYIAQQNQENKT